MLNALVLAQAPDAARPGRDTTNDTHGIFLTGGEPAEVDDAPDGDGYCAAICLVLTALVSIARGPCHVTNDVVDDVTDGGMVSSVRRHPSEFRPHPLCADFAVPGRTRSVPGERHDPRANFLVDPGVGRGNDHSVHPPHLPW